MFWKTGRRSGYSQQELWESKGEQGKLLIVSRETSYFSAIFFRLNSKKEYNVSKNIHTAFSDYCKQLCLIGLSMHK